MTEGLIDQEARTPGRLLAAIARSADLRVKNRAHLILVGGSETFTLAAPLVRDLSVALAVPEADVRAAIEEGEKTGVVRVVRDRDDQSVVALRADPF